MLSRRARVDEAFLVEWFEYGFLDLLDYLSKAARYYEWCRAHNRQP